MKKTAILLSCSLLLGCMSLTVPIHAEAESEAHSDGTEQFSEHSPEALYEQILSSEEMPLAEALNLLSGITTENADILSLREELQELQKCEGIFIQKKDENSTKNTYSATVSFSLKKGTVMCSVDYDNYSGDLSEAPAEPLADDPDYLFVTRPEGTFFSKTHSFEILLGEEDMHIAWADTCEYDLYRSDGSAEELENETVAFENSESYQTMMENYDTMFHSFLHRSKYIEEEKTVYTFVALGENTKTLMQQNTSLQESWKTMTDSISAVTKGYQSIISLSVRDGIDDMTEGHCTIMFVAALKDSDIYSPTDILAVISDGEIIYDCTGNAQAPDASSGTDSTSDAATETEPSFSDDIPRTRGEENALKKAHSYLDYSAFSYSGLIDQLKYEGYSSSEATYAADHCGADWKEQAVKKAKSYLKYSSFSYDGLVDQLEYEGFTHEQAAYGADKAY